MVPPAAPTPPPAAPSSVVSYPGSQNGQSLCNSLQRPPPLGHTEVYQAPQHLSHPARPPGHVQAPRHYYEQPPPAFGNHSGWQYTNPMAEQHRRFNGAPAAEVIESQSRHMNEQSHYHRYEHAYDAASRHGPPQSTEETSVPVMICHTCSHCGRLRSVGFHRNNPVLPGKPLVCLPCRRCKKKLRGQYSSTFTRIRSCTADVPCDWPSEPVHFDIERSEHRGRRRDRNELYETQAFLDRPHIFHRSSSQMNLGLGALQQPPRRTKTETRLRISSLSPHRCSRYDEVWPPPDVVSMRHSRSNEMLSAGLESLSCGTRKTSEVWPPPDVVCTHSYRKINTPHQRLSRVSSRIIELSPSPSPPQSRIRREKYRTESRDRRSRSRTPSPVEFRSGRTRHSESKEARVTAHPRSYRPVLSDHPSFHRGSDATSSDTGSMASRRPGPSSAGILKTEGGDHETSYRRRTNMHESQHSIAVEVGGPRVQFSGSKRDNSSVPESRSKILGSEERFPSTENYKQHQGYSRYRYVERPGSPEPPVKEFEELRFRHVSPLPRKRDEGSIRVERSRRLSPSPPPARSHEDKVSSHRSSRAPLSPERSIRSSYRHVSHSRSDEPYPHYNASTFSSQGERA